MYAPFRAAKLDPMQGMQQSFGADGLSASAFDLLANNDPALAGDVAFYASIFPSQPALVLELGCDTGRVSLALSGRGWRVVGLSASVDKLKNALHKRWRAGPEVAGRLQFLLADFETFALGCVADAVIAPHFAMARVEPGAARRRVLARIVEHLKPGGLAAIHMPCADFAAPPRPDGLLADLSFTGGERLVATCFDQRYDAETGILERLLEYRAHDAKGAEVGRSLERMVWHVAPIEEDLDGSGLTVVRKLGPFNRVGEISVLRRD